MQVMWLGIRLERNSWPETALPMDLNPWHEIGSLDFSALNKKPRQHSKGSENNRVLRPCGGGDVSGGCCRKDRLFPSFPREASWSASVFCSSFIFLLSFLMLGGTLAQGASVQVDIDRESISAGETATLTLTLEGANLRGNQPQFPSSDALRISPSGQSSQLTIINGRQTMQLSLLYSVEALKTGDFVIPAIPVATDAGTFRTRPIRVKVRATSVATAGNGSAFLQIVPRKTTVYLGEILPIEVQLYVEEGRLLQGPQLSGDGFNFGKIADPTQARTPVNNRVLNLVTFRTVATPVKSGTLSLGPISLLLEVPVPGSRPDFFFGRPSQQFKAVAEAVPITVLPLPAGAPKNFTGAVGQYSMDYSAGPSNLAVGDPITLKIAIRGNGMIDTLALPKLDAWTGFKFYPPNSRTEMGDTLETSGARYFEQVVVPQNPEIKQLPAFTWSYFDPEAKAYRTLSGQPTALQIASAPNPTLPLPTLSTNATAGSGAPGTPNLVHILPQIGSVLPPPAPSWKPQTLVGFQLLPIGLWGLSCWYRKRQLALANNPRMRRQIEVQKQVEVGLKTLQAQAQQGNADAFFLTLSQLLRAQIGERLNIPESSITESIIQERLIPIGLSSAEAASLETLFREINQFRYAPNISAAQLAHLIPQTEQMLKALKRLPSA